MLRKGKDGNIDEKEKDSKMMKKEKQQKKKPIQKGRKAKKKISIRFCLKSQWEGNQKILFREIALKHNTLKAFLIHLHGICHPSA